MHFECTAPGTTQQNGRVERRFQTLHDRVRAILSGSGLTKVTRTFLWPDAVNNATDLDAIIIKGVSGVSSFTKFFGEGKKISPVSRLPKKFGETVIVSDRTKIKVKLADRRKSCLWVGYASHHQKETFRIYNPSTRKIIISRGC